MSSFRMTSKTVRAVINQPVGNVLVPGTPEPLSEPPSSPVLSGESRPNLAASRRDTPPNLETNGDINFYKDCPNSAENDSDSSSFPSPLRPRRGISPQKKLPVPSNPNPSPSNTKKSVIDVDAWVPEVVQTPSGLPMPLDDQKILTTDLHHKTLGYFIVNIASFNMPYMEMRQPTEQAVANLVQRFRSPSGLMSQLTMHAMVAVAETEIPPVSGGKWPPDLPEGCRLRLLSGHHRVEALKRFEKDKSKQTWLVKVYDPSLLEDQVILGWLVQKHNDVSAPRENSPAESFLWIAKHHASSKSVILKKDLNVGGTYAADLQWPFHQILHHSDLCRVLHDLFLRFPALRPTFSAKAFGNMLTPRHRMTFSVIMVEDIHEYWTALLEYDSGFHSASYAWPAEVYRSTGSAQIVIAAMKFPMDQLTKISVREKKAILEKVWNGRSEEVKKHMSKSSRRWAVDDKPSPQLVQLMYTDPSPSAVMLSGSIFYNSSPAMKLADGLANIALIVVEVILGWDTASLNIGKLKPDKNVPIGILELSEMSLRGMYFMESTWEQQPMTQVEQSWVNFKTSMPAFDSLKHHVMIREHSAEFHTSFLMYTIRHFQELMDTSDGLVNYDKRESAYDNARLLRLFTKNPVWRGLLEPFQLPPGHIFHTSPHGFTMPPLITRSSSCRTAEAEQMAAKNAEAEQMAAKNAEREMTENANALTRIESEGKNRKKTLRTIQASYKTQLKQAEDHKSRIEKMEARVAELEEQEAEVQEKYDRAHARMIAITAGLLTSTTSSADFDVVDEEEAVEDDLSLPTHASLPAEPSSALRSLVDANQFLTQVIPALEGNAAVEDMNDPLQQDAFIQHILDCMSNGIKQWNSSAKRSYDAANDNQEDNVGQGESGNSSTSAVQRYGAVSKGKSRKLT